MENLDKTCFMISPIWEKGTPEYQDFREIFDYEIKPSIKEVVDGIKVLRADDIHDSGSLTKDILECLEGAFIAIADMTGQKANVLYELGVRHALSLRTILIAREKKDIPTDLLEYRTIIYDPTSRKGSFEFREVIKEYIRKIINNPQKPDNPVFDKIKPSSSKNGTTRSSTVFDFPTRFQKELERMNAKREKIQWVVPSTIKKQGMPDSLRGGKGNFELYVVYENKIPKQVLYVALIDQKNDMLWDLIDTIKKLVKKCRLDDLNMEVVLIIASDKNLNTKEENIIRDEFEKIPANNKLISLENWYSDGNRIKRKKISDFGLKSQLS